MLNQKKAKGNNQVRTESEHSFDNFSIHWHLNRKQLTIEASKATFCSMDLQKRMTNNVATSH